MTNLSTLNRPFYMNRKNVFRSAKEHHRLHTWDLNNRGIYVKHSYTDMTPESLTWWDDFGFVYAKRIAMVWWVHPRMVYSDRLEQAALDACADKYPKESMLCESRSTPIKRRFRRGRRVKTVGYRMSAIREEYRTYFDLVNSVQEQMSGEDHGWVIPASIKSCALRWGQGIDLVYPDEVRSEDDLSVLRDKTVRILRGDRSLLLDVPVYTFQDWKRDVERRNTLQQQTSE